MTSTRGKFGWASSVSDRTLDYSAYGFLVVDDEPAVISIILDVLRTCRARHVKTASNGKQACEILTSNPEAIDVVISDCKMAPVNGLQLLQSIRQSELPEVSSDLPVIFVTGHGDAPIVERALKLKVNGFLVKPVSLEKLVAAVTKVIQAKE